VTELLQHLRRSLDAGNKLLVPYLMAGAPDRASFAASFAAIAEHADAVEIGIPFSDPLMDGPVIAAAGERAIRNGTGPLEAVELAASVDGPCPKLVMTYYNPIHSVGEREFCTLLRDAGVAGMIVPDLPNEESSDLRAAAAEVGIAWIPLVAPTSPKQRVQSVAATATGFVYAVSTLGVTGARTSLSERAAAVVEACRAATDLPVLVGVGVSNAAQAKAAASTADGVVIGSAVVRLLMEEGPGSAAEFLAGVRRELATPSG